MTIYSFGNASDANLTSTDNITLDITSSGDGTMDLVIPSGVRSITFDSLPPLGSGVSHIGKVIIKLGDGVDDFVTTTSGGGQEFFVGTDGSNITNDFSIRLGSTEQSDNGYLFLSVAGSITNHSITPADGDMEFVTATDTMSNDIVTPINYGKSILSNGPNDSVSLGAGSGGDYIATGTGSGDVVDVCSHTHADIFAFALGTNGTDYTTVFGAQVGDQVEVNNGQLGSTG